jgi:ribosomal protein S18 acetylase RimI-like enzyme
MIQVFPTQARSAQARHNGAMPSLPDPVATLPGSRWRPLAADDVDAYADLQEAARIADAGEEVMTREVARHELTDPNCPVATNTLALALPDGKLAGSIMVHQRLQGLESRRIYLWGVTHPDHRGKGIGRALLDWGVARGEEILADQPAHLLRVVEAYRDERLADAITLHESAGFQSVRWYFDMRRDLREPIPAEATPLPVRIEGYEPALAERVRAAHNEAFADHWGSEPLTPELWTRDFVGDPYFRGDLSFVAFDGGEVAGYTVNYVAEADWEAAGIREGWVGQLGVRRPWRKRGLATALLVRSMRAFRDAGLDAASLGVDAENPTGALGVYERIGFRPFRRSVRMQRPYGG